MSFSDTFRKLYCVPGSVLPFDNSTGVIAFNISIFQYFTFLINPCNENVAQKQDE